MSSIETIFSVDICYDQSTIDQFVCEAQLRLCVIYHFCFSIRVSQIDQQSSITSELSALYLYENQKMPNYDFQTEDYTNLEPLKALTPEDLQMLGLPDSGGCEMENTEEIDQYWSSQVRISGEPVATSTQMASSLSVGNAMPELTMEDLNPYESFAFSASNVECEEEEEEDEQDEEQDAELNVKFL